MWPPLLHRGQVSENAFLNLPPFRSQRCRLQGKRALSFLDYVRPPLRHGMERRDKGFRRVGGGQATAQWRV